MYFVVKFGLPIPRGGGGEGTLLYKLYSYRCVRPQTGMVFEPFQFQIGYRFEALLS